MEHLIMTLFAISDAVWLAVLGIIGLILREHFDRLRAKDIAIKVNKVKEDLDIATEETNNKLESVAITGEKTHALANSAMLEQKHMLAISARKLAELEPTTVNIAAAEIAEKHYEEHKAKQDTVDSRFGSV